MCTCELWGNAVAAGGGIGKKALAVASAAAAVAHAGVEHAHAGAGTDLEVGVNAVVQVAHRIAVAGQVLHLGQKTSHDPRIFRGQRKLLSVETHVSSHAHAHAHSAPHTQHRTRKPNLCAIFCASSLVCDQERKLASARAFEQSPPVLYWR